jgi:hypothetical protein
MPGCEKRKRHYKIRILQHRSTVVKISEQSVRKYYLYLTSPSIPSSLCVRSLMFSFKHLATVRVFLHLGIGILSPRLAAQS